MLAPCDPLYAIACADMIILKSAFLFGLVMFRLLIEKHNNINQHFITFKDIGNNVNIHVHKFFMSKLNLGFLGDKGYKFPAVSNSQFQLSSLITLLLKNASLWHRRKASRHQLLRPLERRANCRCC